MSSNLYRFFKSRKFSGPIIDSKLNSGEWTTFRKAGLENVHNECAKGIAFKKLKNLSARQLIVLQRDMLRAYYANPVYLFKKNLSIREMINLIYFARLGVQFFIELILKKRGRSLKAFFF